MGLLFTRIASLVFVFWLSIGLAVIQIVAIDKLFSLGEESGAFLLIPVTFFCFWAIVNAGSYLNGWWEVDLELFPEKAKPVPARRVIKPFTSDTPKTSRPAARYEPKPSMAKMATAPAIQPIEPVVASNPVQQPMPVIQIENINFNPRTGIQVLGLLPDFRVTRSKRHAVIYANGKFDVTKLVNQIAWTYRLEEWISVYDIHTITSCNLVSQFDDITKHNIWRAFELSEKSVLFLDQAQAVYALPENIRNTVVDTLIKYMNHQKGYVLIMAGSSKEMRALLDTYPPLTDLVTEFTQDNLSPSNLYNHG